MKRRRVKHEISFEERLAAEAKRLQRAEPKPLSPGIERDEFDTQELAKPKQPRAMNEWLTVSRIAGAEIAFRRGMAAPLTMA